MVKGEASSLLSYEFKKYILNGMTDLINIFQIGFERHRYVISYIKHADFTVQYKLEYGILDNGIKLDYVIQMRATGIFTT